MRWRIPTTLTLLGICLLAPAPGAHAQKPESVAKPAADNSIEAELASFTPDSRFQVNLFADESMGVANPVTMRWDAQGRLWVLCTWAYPQLPPETKPDDKLLILEDTDGDGKADKVTPFVTGLNMPTGFALGHGGVYVGEGPDLLHFTDTNSDGRADKREVLFTGFGTGDTHQNINSFSWSPGGELFFCQGLHAFSRVETPWGIRGLEEYGTWRLRPLRRQLDPFRRSSSGGNPWGVTFGDWGEPFVKSNSPTIHELLPGMVATEHTLTTPEIGRTKIKSMVIEILDSPHLPDDMQGDMLIAGYFAHVVDRLRPSADGSGHKLENLQPLLTSSHSSFRPVDIHVGPDGGIYIADWFNPIIGHYQASFRHPDRDKSHGRIWRVTAKGRSLTKPAPIGDMHAAQLCEQLGATTRWAREQAKLRLMDLPRHEALPAVDAWLKSLDMRAPDYEHNLFEAIGVYESHETANLPLLEKLLSAKDHRARAYAARVIGRWSDRLKDPLGLLTHAASDLHPRVRLEAIVACSEIHSREAVQVAALAMSQPTDRFIEHAFVQTVHALADVWKPDLVAGRMTFATPDQLVTVLKAYGGDDVLALARQRLVDEAAPNSVRHMMGGLLASIGTTADAQLCLEHAVGDPSVYRALASSAAERGLKAPPNAAKALKPLLQNAPELVRSEALRLCGLWKLREHATTVAEIASNKETSIPLRVEAIEAMGSIPIPGTAEQLATLAGPAQPVGIRYAAIQALAKSNLPQAAAVAASMLTASSTTDVNRIMSAVLPRKGGADALANALESSKPTADTAKLMQRWLNAAGRNEPRLSELLRGLIGSQGEVSAYSAGLVAQLAKHSAEKGDANRGRKIFESPLASCTACHQLEGVAGASTAIKGPSLTAVASGLPVELLIESVLWPERQIKEGYEALNVTTKDGRVFTGFNEGQERGVLRMRDLVTGEVVSLPVSSIATRNAGGTVMPQGLTAGLTHAELLDLIKFLSSLKSTDALPRN